MPTYRPPATSYFNGLLPSLNLAQMAGYARAEERGLAIGPNVQVQTIAPFHGPTEYSPYGAALLERSRELIERMQASSDPVEKGRLEAELDEVTGRWWRALVAGPSTAPLGVPGAPTTPDGRRIWARMNRAVYAGKSKYMLQGAGVSADFQAIETELTDEMMARLARESDARKRAKMQRALHSRLFAETVVRLSCNYGFINIEDAAGADLPVILGVLESLRGQCGVWDDDMMGTGIATAMGFLGWMLHSGRKDFSQLRGAIFGAGAGGYGIYKELLKHGALPGNILVTDRGPGRDESGKPYPIHEGRDDIADDPSKMEMREGIHPDMTVEGFLEGADFVLNLGVRETLTRDPVWTEGITRRLTENFLFGPMTNPDAGVTPEQLWGVRKDGYYASGDQTKPNAFNNFVGFIQMALGVTIARAGSVGPEMTIGAAHGGLEVAKLGPPDWLRPKLPKWRQEFGRGWLIAHPEDTRLMLHEARAIAMAAAQHGYSKTLGPNPAPAALKSFEESLEQELRFRKDLVDDMRRNGEKRGRVYLRKRFGDRYDPFSLRKGDYPAFHVNPKVGKDEFTGFATRMGIHQERLDSLFAEGGELLPNALSTVLKTIRSAITAEEKAASSGRRRGRPKNGAPRIAVRDTEAALKELELITQIARLNPALGLALALRRTRVRDQNLRERPTVFHRPAALRTVLEEIPMARADIQRAFPDIQVPDGLPLGG